MVGVVLFQLFAARQLDQFQLKIDMCFQWVDIKWITEYVVPLCHQIDGISGQIPCETQIIPLRTL